MNRSVSLTVAHHTRPPLNPLDSGLLPPSRRRSSRSRSKAMSTPSDHSTSKTVGTQRYSQTPESSFLSRVQNGFMGKENNFSAYHSRRTSSNASFPLSHQIMMVSTSRQHSASVSRDSSVQENLHGTHGTSTHPPGTRYPKSTFNSTLMAPSPSHCLPQKRIHSPLELISTWPHRHPPSSVQSQPSDRYPSTSQGPQTLLPFHEGSVPSPVITLSEKSANTYSAQVSQPVVFQGTPSAKVRQSLRQPKASPANRLCNLEDGRAMQSTFISTTFPKPPVQPILPH